MARNDGVDRVSVRNVNLTRAKVVNAQRHNEREKSAYTNPDIVSERISDLRERLRSAERDTDIWRHRYDDLNARTKEYQAAMQLAPNQVREAIERVLANTGRVTNRNARGKQREEMLA